MMRLCEVIAGDCLNRTKEPNATLGEGPNAWGIIQVEFDTIVSKHPDLARVLQSGVAHNMFSLVRDHGTKGDIWCLVELSGVWSLKMGLTLKRGQFIERDVARLASAILPNPGSAP